MASTVTKASVFREIALANFQGREVTIDEMREIFVEAGFWTEEELAEATREFMNTQLRRFARKKFRDDDGNLREMVNIKRLSASPAENQQFFVFLNDTTQEDLEWLIEEQVRTVSKYTEKARAYLDEYKFRFGQRAFTQFQQRLNFDLG